MEERPLGRLCRPCPGHAHDTSGTCPQVLPFGMMVWSAGLAPVKFLTENNNFEKGMMGRIKVGDVVRVPGSLGSSRIISGDLG